jgi:hypothetical protein
VRNANLKTWFVILIILVVLVYADAGYANEGSLVAWGWNGEGECNIPSGTNYIAIAAGGFHSLALKSDGSIIAWGDNYYGECNVPSGNYVAIAAGWGYSLALKSDGSVVAWGDNYYGECNVPPGNFIAIAADSFHSLALKSDGSLVAWGWNNSGVCDDVPAGNNFKAIAAGTSHNLALKSDGSLVAWGNNFECQCCVPDGNNFKAIAAGAVHNVALKSDGSIVAWGRHYERQCEAPTGNNYVAISAGWYHNLALKSDGSLVAWGLDILGRCDVPSGNNFTAIAAGGAHSLAIEQAGTQWMVGKVPYFWQYLPNPANECDSTQSTEWCGQASLKMVLEYWECPVTLHEINEAIGNNGDDPSYMAPLWDFNLSHFPYLKDLPHAAQKFGFQTKVGYSKLLEARLPLSVIEEWIDKDIPVIVALQMPQGGHYVVVVGYDNTSIYYNDPSDGYDLRMNRDTFKSRWDSCNAFSPLLPRYNGYLVVYRNNALHDKLFSHPVNDQRNCIGQGDDISFFPDVIYFYFSETPVSQITQGKSETKTFLIDPSIERFKAEITWSGSDLDLILVKPNGTVVDPNYADIDPKITYVEKETSEYYVIENPEPGEWIMKITGVDVPIEGEEYTASVYLTTDLVLTLSSDTDIYGPNEPVTLTAELIYDSNSYSDANVTAVIVRPDGNETVTLFDDGLHNDGNSNDGIYANTFVNTAIEGQYKIIATASGRNPFGEPFIRETSKTILVKNLPDLVPTSLLTTNGPVQDQITLTATILNNGTKDANDVLVQFYDVNDANVVQIGSDVEIDDLVAHEVKEVSVAWEASEGAHTVIVVVDPLDAISEKDEKNNYIGKTFCAGWKPQGDINNDCVINLSDLSEFANNWLKSCSTPSWCFEADFDKSGEVDIFDMRILADHWLESSTP